MALRSVSAQEPSCNLYQPDMRMLSLLHFHTTGYREGWL